MEDSAEKLLTKVASLNDCLDDLEEKLQPLLAQTLPESLLPLDTMQQVKLNVAIPYLVYDLIFIYLKTRGVDPKTHPVVAELERVKQYFDKIKNAEDPEKRKSVLDKAAANRFIRHAIAQVRDQGPPGESSARPNTVIRFDADGNPPASASASVSAPQTNAAASSSSSATPADARSSIPTRVTKKMLQREAYQRKLAEALKNGDKEEEGEPLMVFDGTTEDVGGAMAVDEDEEPERSSSKPKKNKGKGKSKDMGEVPTVQTIDVDEDDDEDDDDDGPGQGNGKKRRAPVDVFAGYGDDASAPSPKPKKKKNSQASAVVPLGAAPVDTAALALAKKERRKEKKAKKKENKAS
ncbi:Sas10/Utp3/C1D family-domain-containing protein [Epithele typhae]|uniref:Sas10/Utp3/C1D family-domain-containing protein n=1 Tax=Epithele typhae TaxID=378194 RepID=UPI0020076DF0|nr:Sas10/Utp3/C1D family-domain-containing protein [Epithele typhae]KAH9932004.1 Sas10/Utp3/C1D family-domain-containing protein [Epithele typhae]